MGDCVESYELRLSLQFRRFRRNSPNMDKKTVNPAMFEQALLRKGLESVEELNLQRIDSYKRDWIKKLAIKGADVKNLSLVFRNSQMSSSLYDLVKGVNLMLHSLHLGEVCIATDSLFNLRRHSQDTNQSFSLGGCHSNETGTYKEGFNELGAHFLLLRTLEIANVSKQILRSVIGQYYMALVWFDR